MDPGVAPGAERNEAGKIINPRLPVMNDDLPILATTPATAVVTPQHRIPMPGEEAPRTVLARVADSAQPGAVDWPFQTPTQS
jgi:hypothetical protein